MPKQFTDADTVTPDGQRLDLLRIALERTIVRLEDEPRILWEKDPSYAEGLNIDEINRLAEQQVFEVTVQRDGEIPIRRWLKVHSPTTHKEPVAYRTWDPNAYTSAEWNEKKVARMLQYLRDWQVWATRDATQPPQGNSRAKNATTAAVTLTKTDEAVLKLIKAQPKGKGIIGKDIIKKLEAKRIRIEKSTLYRHILPKLKAHFGVINMRSAGGYLIPLI